MPHWSTSETRLLQEFLPLSLPLQSSSCGLNGQCDRSRCQQQYMLQAALLGQSGQWPTNTHFSATDEQINRQTNRRTVPLHKAAALWWGFNNLQNLYFAEQQSWVLTWTFSAYLNTDCLPANWVLACTLSTYLHTECLPAHRVLSCTPSTYLHTGSLYLSLTPKFKT